MNNCSVKENGDRMRRRVRKTILILITFTLLLLALTVIVNLYVVCRGEKLIFDSTKDVLENSEYDFVLILGCGVNSNGEPSDMLEHRLRVGAELYLSGKAEKIIVSGNPSAKAHNEPLAMKTYLTEQGIPEEDLLTDNAGISTYESILSARNNFHAKNIIIVTQKYHLHRALHIAQRLGVESHGASATFGSYDMDLYYSVREYVARCKDFFITLFV